MSLSFPLFITQILPNSVFPISSFFFTPVSLILSSSRVFHPNPTQIQFSITIRISLYGFVKDCCAQVNVYDVSQTPANNVGSWDHSANTESPVTSYKHPPNWARWDESQFKLKFLTALPVVYVFILITIQNTVSQRKTKVTVLYKLYENDLHNLLL